MHLFCLRRFFSRSFLVPGPSFLFARSSFCPFSVALRLVIIERSSRETSSWPRASRRARQGNRRCAREAGAATRLHAEGLRHSCVFAGFRWSFCHRIDLGDIDVGKHVTRSMARPILHVTDGQAGCGGALSLYTRCQTLASTTSIVRQKPFATSRRMASPPHRMRLSFIAVCDVYHGSACNSYPRVALKPRACPPILTTPERTIRELGFGQCLCRIVPAW